MTRLLALIVFLFLSLSVRGQAVGDFQSHQTGNWSLTTTWEQWNGSSWVTPVGAVPTTNITAVVTIQVGHNVTLNFSETVTTGSVVVNGTLTFSAVLPVKVLTVNGSLYNNGTMTGANSARLKFGSGSNYYHQFSDGGTIPSASWNSSSTVNIVGYTAGMSTPPSGLNQTFGNFVWNAPNQDQLIILNGLPSNVQGNFTIADAGNSSGTGVLYYSLGGAGAYTLNVGGNFNVGSIFAFTSGDLAASTLNVAGNITVSDSGPFSAYCQFGDDQNITIGCNGSFNVSGSSTVEFSATSAVTNLNLSGDFAQTGASVISASGGTGNINFVSAGVQNYTSTIAPSGNVNYNVNTFATLSLSGSNFIGGTGTFTLSGSLQVGSLAASGAIQNSTSAGNMQVPVSGLNRIYNSSSNIIYNGLGAQKLGNGFPSNVNLVIANSSGVTNNNVGVTNVIGTLTLTSGSFIIGSGNTLNVQSDFTVISGTIGGAATSNLTFSGSGTLGTLAFTSGTEFLKNLTISRTGTVALGSNLTVAGTIALTNGNLDFSSHTLTMNGGSITSSGTGLISNSSSNLVFGGSTYTGSVPFSGSGNQLNNLTFATPGGAFTWGNSVTINSNLTLTAGALTHTSGITMAANSTINMGGGSISGTSPAAASSYNVNYTGSGSTGLELPTTATALNNLTVASSGTVSLASNGITINGNVLLSGGTFSSGSNNLTMKGSSWTVNSGGTFLGGTGIVSFGGTTTIGGTGTISFSNVTTNSGSTITLPSGNINITGDLNLNGTSTFNNGGGTITLNGSGSQTVTGAAKSFNNVTVNKTGGIVDLLPTINLTGLLNIQSSTTVQSNGNLVLISTSDGASGNASIAKIPSGASVTGNVVAQRYISAKGRVFHDISSPVQSATVQQIMNSGITVTGFAGSSYPCGGCATNNASMYLYDETVTGAISNGYTGMASAAQTLTTGRGYDMLDRNEVGVATMVLTGAINSGAVSLPVSYTNSGIPTADGWNLVGNPYPSSINWDISSGWTKSQIMGNMISVWDAGANQYKTWNGSTGSMGNGNIAQGQGFWFQCNSTPTLNITEDAKTPSTGAFLREMSQPIHTVELILAGAGVEDRTYVQQIDGSTLGFDGMDGPKLTFDNFSLSTVVDNDRSVAINAVGEILSRGKMPLKISNIDNGEYTFTQQSLGDFQGVKISIFDKSTNAIHDLSNGEKFTFTFQDNANSRTTDRFDLVFGDAVSNYNQLSLFPNPVAKTVTVHINSNQMPSGEVIDMMGKSIGIVNWEKAPDGPSWTGTFDMQSQSTGVYFIKVNLQEGTQVARFLKN